MAFKIGIVGKPSCGKTSFTNAACMTSFKVGSYPFTTIEANVGVTHVRTKCACQDFEVEDNPQNSICIDGTRLIPIKLIDVAGLVPGAHKGKGMGNQFLDDLRQADVLIHIVDASGTLDEKGQEVAAGIYDPVDDVNFLETEITEWILKIIEDDWRKIVGRVRAEGAKLSELLLDKLSGLKIERVHLLKAIRESGLKAENVDQWSGEDMHQFVEELHAIAKPIIIAANKMDLPTADENYKQLKETYPDKLVVPVSALAEKVLKNLDKQDIIKYIPGDDDFDVLDSDKLTKGELNQLQKIKDRILKKYDGTGVQGILNKAVFDFLDYITVYPVQDVNSLTDSNGNVLPDAYLVPRGTTAKEFAGYIHSDLEDNFIHAVDARTKMRVSDNHILEDRDVIKVVSAGGR